MKVDFDINKIKETLPHRYPFLMVDKIIDIDMEAKKITGIKNVTANEPFFQGHFPQHPVMPGVLIIEALAQTGGILALERPENKGKIAYFATISNAKFRKPVFPGDTLTLEIEITKDKARLFQARGIAKVGDSVVAETEFLFSMFKAEK